MKHHRSTVVIALLAIAACSDNSGPTEIDLGETTFVVLVNPTVNTANQVSVPAPGPSRNGVSVSVIGGPSGTTDATGVVVLGPVAAGTHSIALSGAGASGQIAATIAARDLREIAISSGASGSSEMANLLYSFGGTVAEVRPSMTLQQVNDELAKSNLIVFFRSGTYAGDLVFAGSNVTLFGEGPSGGTVTINGNVTVSGSQNRMRGARITGNLTVPGSSFGMSFSRVNGSFTMAGSNGVLLNNTFCGSATVSGSGARLIGNAGLAPIAAAAGGC